MNVAYTFHLYVSYKENCPFHLSYSYCSHIKNKLNNKKYTLIYIVEWRYVFKSCATFICVLSLCCLICFCIAVYIRNNIIEYHVNAWSVEFYSLVCALSYQITFKWDSNTELFYSTSGYSKNCAFLFVRFYLVAAF